MGLAFRLLWYLTRRLGLAGILLGASWYIGAVYGTPEPLARAGDFVLDRSVSAIRDRLGGASAGNADEKPDIEARAPMSDSSSNAGDEEKTSRIERFLAKLAPAPINKAEATDAPIAIAETMKLCDSDVSNAPRADKNRFIIDFAPLADVNGVSLLTAPATRSCFGSGFGHRGFGPHRGIDYYAKKGGAALAAADGVVLEAQYHDDYGKMVLIDHGQGVYTRYGHLASFEEEIKVGATVARGQPLGPIGKTGETKTRHLHYEVRLGDYDNPEKSWGLEPVDIMTFPAAVG